MPRPFEVRVENLLMLAFFRKNLLATHSAHISESIRKSAKRGHCTRAEQECGTMTD